MRNELPSFGVVDVEPLGTKKVFAHLNYGRSRPHEWTYIDWPDYPPNAEADTLNAARRAAGLGLREAARLLGMRPVDLSGVEFRSKRFVDPAAYQAVRELYAQSATRSPTP